MSETIPNKGGRPKVNATPITVRLPPEQLAALDVWREKQEDQLSRPEAIRRILATATKPATAMMFLTKKHRGPGA